MALRDTHIDLSTPIREQLVASLNATLATCTDLHTQVKQAHWNIRGPQFYARHLLFDELAAKLRKQIDMVAERATTLGGYAEGTVRQAARATVIPEYDTQALSGAQHVRVLADRYAALSKHLRVQIEKASDDPATVDLYTQMLRETELDLWFLESQQS